MRVDDISEAISGTDMMSVWPDRVMQQARLLRRVSRGALITERSITDDLAVAVEATAGESWRTISRGKDVPDYAKINKFDGSSRSDHALI